MPFDPQRHEVVGVVDAPDSAPGTVVEVLRPGYGTGLERSCGRRPWWSADARSEFAWPATTTKSSGCRATRPPMRSSRRFARWPASITRMSTRIRRPRTGSRRSTRPITCCRIPQTRKRVRPIRRRLPPGPEDWEERVGAGAGACAGGFGGRRSAGPARGCATARASAARAASTSKTSSGDMFGGGGGFGPDAGRRPGSGARADRRGGLPAAASGRSQLDGAQLRGHHSRRASSTVSASGWPGRAAGAAAMDRAGDCTWGAHQAASAIPARRTRRLSSICRWRRGRRRWARPSPFALPGGEAKVRSRRARRPAGGCGCAARACPTRAVPPATCTRRSR